MFGGRGDKGLINDVYIIDLERMVSQLIVHITTIWFMVVVRVHEPL